METARDKITMTEKNGVPTPSFAMVTSSSSSNSSSGNASKLTNRRRLRQSGLRNAATHRRLDLQKHLRREKRIAPSLEEIIVNANIGPLEKASPDIHNLKFQRMICMSNVMLAMQRGFRELASEDLAGVTFRQ